jgi:fructan beta-fructosidase
MFDHRPEKFRPQVHFSANSWINDPNGLIYVDGVYHVFYQCDPNAFVQGTMHWGHASTTDLVTWKQHEIALFPDENGSCFSGSAVQTKEGHVKLIYTSHIVDEDGRDFQQQSLVHADTTLTRFDKDPRNPVIKNNGLGCFRDPKVFWHEETSRWIMALSHGESVGQSIGFHSSPDLVHWTFESAFGDKDGRHGDGPWECPDLFPLAASDGSKHWVLVVGIGDPAYGAGSGTMYFIGQFDGRTFTNSNPPNVELWLDFGRDFYAAQSFFGVHRDAPLVLAWANNWKYAQKPVTKGFTGLLSLPRHLKLVNTPDGLRLGSYAPATVQNAFPQISLFDLPKEPSSGVFRLHGNLPLSEGETAALTLFGEAVPQFEFTRGDDGVVSLHQRRGPMEGSPEFEHDYSIPIGAVRDLVLEVFVDNGVVELNVNDLIWTTNIYYPEKPAGQIRFEGTSK